MFFGKKILIGITGGIAVYKTAELVRQFKKAGAQVRVVMTDAATKFVSPLTFETLSENDVLTGLFPETSSKQTAHIEWARWSDVMVICPATLNTIGKIASGIADNALTTTIMAANVPVIFCPAMNKAMFANSIYRENQKKLQEHGYYFVEPGIGELACGEVGYGRLADIETIFDAVKLRLFGKNDFSGKKLLITAGPTEEPLDPVRYLTNLSSGKMGFALAEQAKIRGAEVVLVSGPVNLRTFSGVELVHIRTAFEMEQQVLKRLEGTDVLIMAAAVSDYRPAEYSPNKLKKQDNPKSLALIMNNDILAKAGQNKGNRIQVGFSVETENEYDYSLDKLRRKNCDFIVINNPARPGAGFRNDTNRVTVLDNKGNMERYPLLSKYRVADRILDKVFNLMQNG
ncbi:bifunctional phosphopantothenoylcysteine decarboxylase/phosphopantothenate--cysteine ligase CoaBC [candidate division KSB1 bacterium]|nr:bifunctional phosphopantothenoylcysteine decarboxylase/phosphopantothenate--cysteine ligase CoaBC [candidate division KSB1 bacterium]